MPKPIRFQRLLAMALVLLIITLTACLSKEDQGDSLMVMAAASLTESFTELAADFEKNNPGVQVKLNFAGSQSLRTQIEQGLEADVFAAANKEHVENLISQGLMDSSSVFAANSLALIVPSDNPAGIKSLADLEKPHRLVLAAESVPVGSYSLQILNRAERKFGQGYLQNVKANLVSEETSVRNVLTKVALGEGDAGFVYRTDLEGDLKSKVKAIPVPEEFNVRAEYFIGTLNNSRNAQLGRNFVSYILSPRGQELLRKHGFQSGS